MTDELSIPDLLTRQSHVFSQDALAKIIDTLPRDQPTRHALVTTVDTTGAKVGIRFGRENERSRWHVEAAAGYDWSGDPKAGVNFTLTW